MNTMNLPLAARGKLETRLFRLGNTRLHRKSQAVR